MQYFGQATACCIIYQTTANQNKKLAAKRKEDLNESQAKTSKA